MLVSEFLEKSFYYIDSPDKWIQGRANNRDCTKFCSVGAISRVCDVYGAYRISEFRSLIAESIKTLTNAMDVPTRSTSIVVYNDHNTYETVREAWLRAIRMAKINEAESIQIPEVAEPALV